MRKNVLLSAETESKKIPSLHKNQTIFGDIIQWMEIGGSVASILDENVGGGHFW